MVGNVGGFHHFDCLVNMRVERLPLSSNGTHPEFRKCILQLLVDEFDATAEVAGVGLDLQGTLEAVDDRQ